jgi:hypothetical protein
LNTTIAIARGTLVCIRCLRRTRARAVAAASTLAALWVLAAGCGHVVHPAAVQPGLTLDVVVANDWNRHEPKTYQTTGPTYYPPPPQVGYLSPPGNFEPFTSSRPGLQIAVGYGWRHSENRGTQLQLVGGNLTAPTLDGYFQLLGRPLDAGLGAIITFIGYAGGYGMVGKGIPLGARSELRLDGGVRALLDYAENTRSWGPMGLLSLRRGGVTVGLWGDGLFFDGVTYVLYCDETCNAENFVTRRFSLGGYIRFGRAPAPPAP